MRLCPSCGRRIPESAATTGFCPHCGLDLAPRDALGGLPAEEHARSGASRAKEDYAEGFGFAFRAWLDNLPTFTILGVVNVLVAFALTAPMTLIPAVARISLASEAGVELTPSELLAALPFILLVAYLDTAVNLGFAGAAALLVLRHGAGEGATVKDAFAAFRVNGGTLLVTALVLSAAYLVGAALFVVPLFVFLYWWLFAPAIAATEGATVSEALARSKSFAQEHRTLGYMFIVVGLILAVNLLSVGARSLAGGLDPNVGHVFALVVHAIGYPLVGASAAGLYLARSRSAAPQTEDEQPVVPGFRTTRCPECRTIVPFHYAGEPVEVKCPTCGNSATIR